MLLAVKIVNVICHKCFYPSFFTVIIVVSLTLKNIKLANLNLLATQCNSKTASTSVISFVENIDSRIGRDLGNLI